MTPDLPSYRYAVRTSLIVGFVGAAGVALADLALLSPGSESASLLVLAAAFLKIVLIYAVIGAFGMILAGSLLWGLMRLGHVQTPSVSLKRWIGAAFVYLAVSAALSQAFDLYEKPSPLVFIFVFLISGCVAWAVLSASRALMKKNLPAGCPLKAAGLFLSLGVLVLLRYFLILNKGPSWDSPPPSLVSSANRPNILWIVMDAARADHLSCYGYRRLTTPALDRIAREGTLYQTAISAAPWTFPSHAAMLTGRSPAALGLTFPSWRWVDRQFVRLPGLLRAQGYQTAAISENALFFSRQQNFQRGFDVFRVIRKFNRLEVPERGTALQDLLLSRILRQIDASVRERTLWPGRLRRLFLDAVAFEIKDLGAHEANVYATRLIDHSIQQKTPFFLFINYMEAHPPYGDTPYAGRFLKELSMPLSEASARAAADDRRFLQLYTGQSRLSEPDKAAYNALYDGDLSYLDEKIGQLIESLRQKGILDNTVVIITSDHGSYLGEDNLFSHGFNVSNRLLHVPLIIRYPAAFPSARKVKAAVQLTDLFPTLLDLVKIPAPRALDGVSLLKPEIESRAVVSELSLQLPLLTHPQIDQVLRKFPGLTEDAVIIGRAMSVYQNGYHYVTTRKGEQLYHLQTDPEENHDISRDRPDVLAGMRQHLRDWMKRQGSYWGPRFSQAPHEKNRLNRD